MAKKTSEKGEYERLRALFADMDADRLALIDGLLWQAARLRVRADDLWRDLRRNGETERFVQGRDAEPYDRERPASRTYTATCKLYQQVIRQLCEICPGVSERDALDEFRADG